MFATTAARILLVAAIAWGAFAFGAVYPWAYWPLAVASTVVASLGLLAPGPTRWRARDVRSLTIGLALLLAACCIQLIPLPLSTMSRISPEAPSIISQLEPAVRIGARTIHPLSIAPWNSITAVGVLASFALLLIGLSRLISITGCTRIANAIVMIGVALAVTGIIQHPIYEGQIYGFWSPLQSGATPFGPFVNRNHFAGWMLMTLPLTFGLLSAVFARGTSGRERNFRETVLWLSSPEASNLLLLLGAAGIMTLAVILTNSRSGTSGAVVALLGFAFTLRRFRSSGRVAATAVTVGMVLLLVVAWAGTDAIASRFANSSEDANSRIGIWRDTLHIIATYPLAGTGLNTYSVAMLFYQRFDTSVEYAQAHNDYLQLAAEGGLLLTVPAAGCLVAFVFAVRRRFAQDTSTSTGWIRTGAVIGVMAIAFQETVEFSLQMPGNALLFVVLGAIALHAPKPHERGLPLLNSRLSGDVSQTGSDNRLLATHRSRGASLADPVL